MQQGEELRPHLQPGAPLSGSVPGAGGSPLPALGRGLRGAAPPALREQAHLGVPRDQRDREAQAQPASSCSERPGTTGASRSALSPCSAPAPSCGAGSRGGRGTRGSLRAGSGRQRGRAARGPRAVAAQRGAGGARRGARENRQAPSHSLILSLSFLSVPLCRSACYIPPFLHIFLLGFRVHSLEIRFTVK